MRRPRPADAARLGLGALLLARPHAAVALAGSPDGVWVRRVVRILGVRYVLQSTVGLAVEQRWLRGADTAVDLVHAASMLGFARALPDHRRLALLSGGAAIVFAGLDLTEQAR